MLVRRTQGQFFSAESGPADTDFCNDQHAHLWTGRIHDQNYQENIKDILYQLQAATSSHIGQVQGPTKMLSIITTLLLTLASVSFASPVIHFRQTGLSPSCDGFGDGAFDTASNFTLAAFNKPFVEGETGIPLVITLFQTFDGSDFFALSVSSANPAHTFCWSSVADHHAMYQSHAD